jgi:hypothetical protein
MSLLRDGAKQEYARCGDHSCYGQAPCLRKLTHTLDRLRTDVAHRAVSSVFGVRRDGKVPSPGGKTRNFIARCGGAGSDRMAQSACGGAVVDSVAGQRRHRRAVGIGAGSLPYQGGGAGERRRDRHGGGFIGGTSGAGAG